MTNEGKAMEQLNMFNGEPITDGITAGVEERKMRGMEIAAQARIERQDGFYLVPSVTNPRQTRYKVSHAGGRQTCNCPDHETRGCKCKHIYAVEYVIRREQHSDGSTTVVESLTVTETRKTYAQDWPAYNQAQTNEKRHFLALLAELCDGLEEQPDPNEKPRRGRPPLPLSEAVFGAVFKTYSVLSARRFECDLADAQEKGYISKVPHFNAVLRTLDKPEMFNVLTKLIERTAAPLQSVETKFAVDSTGFSFSRFVRWYDIKYNRFTSEKQWVKAHLMCGVKTNVVTAVEIHGKDAGDALQLPPLVESTAKRFDVKEVSADKGYSSRACHEAIAKIGATPYIAFKAWTTGGVGGVFKKMFHYFQFNREDFLNHYHNRSNVESTMMMIKTKFGDSVRSKTEVAAKNEVLCKVLCHNICCLIHAMYELGIHPMLAK